MIRLSCLAALALGCSNAQGPDDGETDTGPDVDMSRLVLNELQPANETTVSDEEGEFDDWVELYNDSGAAVDLSGWLLTEGLDAGETPWAIPDGTTLGHGEYLLIWADEDEDQGALHADFKLSREGETVSLLTPDEVVHDEVVFQAVEADTSWARKPDGGNWGLADTPTPGSSND